MELFISMVETFGFPLASIVALAIFIKNMWKNQIDTND